MKKIMIVDDEAQAVENISRVLEKEGFVTATFTSALHAVQTLEAVEEIDLVLTDIRMPSVDGTEVMKAALGRKRPVPVIVFSGYGDIDTAVNLMKAGASDYLTKPLSAKELVIRVNNVLEKQEIADEVENLRKRLAEAETFHSIVGKDKSMEEVYSLIDTVAGTDVTVLIRGETGTGKELVARAVHEASLLKDEPFVPISCTTLQHTLLESELFGHEKGAFTGAHATKTGKLEGAGSGTVFLDEVGDTPAEIQAKLLRVLQEREFERVGGIRPIKMKARVLAATNTDLEEAVRAGSFREDLYFRLNVVEIHLPPLRERPGDITLLANHFLERFTRRHSKTIEGFSPGAMEQLLEYPWPGNVRELENAIERTVLTNPRRWIDRISGLRTARGHRIFDTLPEKVGYARAKEVVGEELERAFLEKYMKEERGRIGRVAEKMGVSTRTISRMLNRYGLDKVSFKKS